MSHKVKKYRKILLEPLANFNVLMKEAETLYLTEQGKCQTSRNEFNSLTNSNNSISKTHLKSPLSIKRKEYISHRLYNSSYDIEKFNLLKTIKEIKQITTESYNSKDPFLKNKFRIGFDKNKCKYVFDSRKQILDYKKKRANRLTDRDGSLNKFLFESKHIGINNYLIKYLNKESEKLNNKIETNNKKIEDNKFNYNENNEQFINYIQNQNIFFKQIEKSYGEIGKLFRELLREEYKQKYTKKTIDDEIEKILIYLEELRVCCKFITELTKKEEGKFDKPILEKDSLHLIHSNNEEFDFDKLTFKTINNYKFCIERNKEEEKELNEILNDPNMMEFKFNEIEDRIIRLLKLIEEIQKDEKNMNDDIINIIKDMKIRFELNEKEFESLKEIYNNELIEVNKIHYNDKNIDMYLELIKEIYSTLLQNENGNSFKYIYSNNHFNNKNNNFGFSHHKDLIKDCIQKIKKEENTINNCIRDLEKYEFQDPKLFNKIIELRKEYNKEKKQLEQKRKLENIRNENKEKSENRFNKVIIQSRKTEAPFRLFKKTIKAVKEMPKYNSDYEMLIYK